MMWLTAFFFFVEIIVGYVTNSMALVADSFHMLGDIAALVISFLSVKVSVLAIYKVIYDILNMFPYALLQMSPKKWSKNTFGWARAEVLGALVNAVFLVALCFSITIEACKRWDTCERAMGVCVLYVCVYCHSTPCKQFALSPFLLSKSFFLPFRLFSFIVIRFESICMPYAYFSFAFTMRALRCINV